MDLFYKNTLDGTTRRVSTEIVVTVGIKAECVMLSSREIQPGGGGVFEACEFYWHKTHLGAFSPCTNKEVHNYMKQSHNVQLN